MKTIKIVVCEPNKAAEVREVEATLGNYQKIVDGYIEPIPIAGTKYIIVCNEEGKLNQLPFNRYFSSCGVRLDAFVGTIFIATDDGEKISGLSDDDCNELVEMLKDPEEDIDESCFLI